MARFRFRVPMMVCSAVLAVAMPEWMSGQDVPRVDYLTFAQGAVPVRVGGAAAARGANFDGALQMIDGNPLGVSLTNKPGPADTDTEFVYTLPAPTTFNRFAVPNVLETPSPTQTFTKLVEVFGSATGADDGFVLLASGTLQTHKTRGQVAEIPVVVKETGSVGDAADVGGHSSDGAADVL